MPFNVLVTRPIPDGGLDILRQHCDPVDIGPEDRPYSPNELAEAVQGRDGLISTLVDPIDERVITAAGPRLKVIAQIAVGYDNIDLAAARARGVTVTNTPGVLTDATADLTWTLILSIARRVVEGDRLVRSGQWTGWAPMQLLGARVTGQTLGIVGAGRIGTAVARRAAAFDMPVLYVNSHPNPTLDATGATKVDLDRCLADADYVSIHVPLTPETHHMIAAPQLARMRPSAYLINAARGPIVDEAALTNALRQGRIAGAAIDVYEHEPTVTPGLTQLPNVICLPHLGSATRQTRATMARIAANNLIAVLTGQTPPNCVGS